MRDFLKQTLRDCSNTNYKIRSELPLPATNLKRGCRKTSFKCLTYDPNSQQRAATDAIGS